MKVQVLLVAKLELPGEIDEDDPALDELVQERLDAFREVVQPNDYELSLTRATEVTLMRHGPHGPSHGLTSFTLPLVLNDVFVVHEHCNGFEVKHLPSGDTHWLGDGVDCLFDENERAISPGTPGFAELWTWQLNKDPETVTEAYFPQWLENPDGKSRQEDS